ncbi:hypothetical protein ABH922_004694 [Rhodococcus sp. 27YEA15]|uniref:hypothetical protein n=1 Tax=Rhodococcus sp. 27YEA15 TaxID=3156259 RepID=UPI003C7C7CD9
MSTLGERQEALVRALVAGSEIPEGFDTDAVSAAAAALLRKRAAEVAHHLPGVRHHLGDRYLQLFTEWAHGRPKTSSRTDATAFTAHLESIGELVRPPRWHQRRLRRQ